MCVIFICISVDGNNTTYNIIIKYNVVIVASKAIRITIYVLRTPIFTTSKSGASKSSINSVKNINTFLYFYIICLTN